MSKTLQFRRYTTANVANTTGASGELIVDSTLNIVTVHDGSTSGGFQLAANSFVKTNIATINGVDNSQNNLIQLAWNTANNAYNQGNTDLTYLASNVASLLGIDVNTNTNISLAWAAANSAGEYANGAFAAANSAGEYANGAFAAANSAGEYANGAFAEANSAYNKANSALYSGTLTYSASGLFAAFSANANSYQQIVLENSNTGTQASADYIVSNLDSTDGFLYGDFGINGINFTGTGALSTANNVYLYSSNTDLVIGTATSNTIHFVVNNGATDAMNITSSGVVNVNGNLSSSGLITTTGNGIGYTTGSGGTVSQLTSKLTGVTLNKPSGQITLFSSPMTSGTSNTFVLTNSTISANDFLLLNHFSGGTIGNYTLSANTSTGQANITIHSISTVSAEAPVIQYVIIKGATS